jgi:hypothetical protein
MPLRRKSRISVEVARRLVAWFVEHAEGIRAGKLRTVRFKEVMLFNVPYLNMASTVTDLWKSFKEKPPAGLEDIGARFFSSMYHAVGQLIKQEHSLSYYYTDAYHAVNTVAKMLKSLKEVCGSVGVNAEANGVTQTRF